MFFGGFMDLIPFLKRCLALACCVAGLFLLCWIVSEAISTEKEFRKSSYELLENSFKTDLKNNSKIMPEESFSVEKIIKFVSVRDINSAEKFFRQENFKDLCGENLYAYFENFFSYIKKGKKAEIEETYFIRTGRIVEEYFKDKKYSAEESFRLSEQIPYYIAKNYVQNQSKDSMISFSEEYKNYFSKFDSISKENADVICLYFYSYYKNHKTNNDWLKTEINEISKIQQRYRALLGENGIYIKQRDYLKNLSDFLKRKSNSLIDRPSKAIVFWKRFEKCPVYRF